MSAVGHVPGPRRGEIWWADRGEPRGSEPGKRRPVVVVQSDRLNDSRLNTVMVVPLTSNQRRAVYTDLDASLLVRLQPFDEGGSRSTDPIDVSAGLQPAGGPSGSGRGATAHRSRRRERSG